MSIWARPPCLPRTTRSPLLRPSQAPHNWHELLKFGDLVSGSTVASAAKMRCCVWKEYEEVEDGGDDVEVEILEFMRNSARPEAFPSRSELVDAGRSDLAEAIVEKGGWLSLGWYDEEEEEDTAVSQHKVGGEEPMHDRSTHKSFLELMDRSSEKGIEGILNRLEKQRSFGFGFEDENEEQTHSQLTTDTKGGGFSRMNKSISLRALEDNNAPTKSAHHPQMWSIQHPQSSHADSQEDESKEPTNANELDKQDELSSLRGIEHPRNQLQSRLHRLHSELSSALYSLRSNGEETATDQSFSEDLPIRYDAWEFQENEIMKTEEKLRSTRAKLAVLEGKMTLAIIEAQKIVEEKQKRIDDARRASRLMCSTCIVWPNPASEVLLAGSFDGWATLRKMEKSSIGIFYQWLQLYPGRYEIKFMVDGEWTIDPHRRLVNNNGHMNNLLII